MKKLILTCSLIATASVVSFGQNAHSSNQTANAAPAPASVRQAPAPEAIAEKRAKAYQHSLKLTPEQYKVVYEAELDYVKQDQMTRMNGGPGPGPGQAMQMQMAKDQKIKAVLTAEQSTKYEVQKSKTGN